MATNRLTASNPLVVSGKAPDTAVNVQLHPLVLLTISDYITRHTLRQEAGPIVGAIIGQLDGKDITLEHAYDCRLADGSGGTVKLDGEWFLERLAMFKEVHKAPAQLDLAAIFMLSPASGPQEEHLQMLQQIQELTGTDGILLLVFHPEMVDKLQGGKLPISLYETVQEQVEGKTENKFRELTFEVETGEAEMISVDFVAKGGANAAAVASASSDSAASKGKKGSKVKGKGKEKEADTSEETEAGSTPAAASAVPESYLTPEDEELISSLNAKVNAIKMLDERINLLRKYLESLPKSCLTESASSATEPSAPTSHPIETNHVLLRHIQSLLSRLPLLTPPKPDQETFDINQSALNTAATYQKSSVHLTSLLVTLSRSLAEAQTLSGRLDIVRREKAVRERRQGPRGGMYGMPNE